MYGSIKIRGARENNLKNVSLDIPKRKITVFTGVSGSGKSSLVFGTIAAESQRLINDTYPAFVQQFMPRYGQPDADSLENLSAAIIVDQQRLGGNSRSTVATVTDAAQMLRVIFARLAEPHLGSPSLYSFMGPRAGSNGGEIVYEGPYEGLLKSGTLTGNHIKKYQPMKLDGRKPDGALKIKNARLNNLKNLTVSIPRGVLTVVTGVAGAGKS
jgi:excinuclease UvrABC ATPase subunit